MEVILLERVEKLGQIGDIVNVKDGYARNFLIPNHKCLRATRENKKIFESKKAELELKNIKKKEEAEKILSKIDNYELILIKNAGETGFLYGSVKGQEISVSLTQEGFHMHKNQVIMGSPLKSIGVHKVNISLHPEVQANIMVNIARTSEDATRQMEEFLNPPVVEEKHPHDKTKKEQEEEATFEAFETVEKTKDEEIEPIADTEETKN